MVVANIAVLGLSFFIIKSSQRLLVRETYLKSLYISEAGIQEAIYWYAQNGYFSLGEKVVSLGQKFNLEADDAGLLMVDLRESKVVVTNPRKIIYECQDSKVKDATNSRDLTITEMMVSWDVAGARLELIKFVNKRVWSGNTVSPANCNIDDTTIDGVDKVITLQFQGANLSSATIRIGFTMGDGSYKELEVYPSSQQANFTVKSEASIERGGPTFMTAVEAEYNSAISQIVSYEKVQ